MNLNKYLDIAPEVQQALADGRPVVALESTIISHGMPYPKNVETALLVEQTLRDNGSFKPTDLLSRAQLAQVFRSFYETQLAFVLDELPAAPEQPSTPEQPSVPEQPSTPVQPSVPEQPSMPTAA